MQIIETKQFKKISFVSIGFGVFEKFFWWLAVKKKKARILVKQKIVYQMCAQNKTVSSHLEFFLWILFACGFD